MSVQKVKVRGQRSGSRRSKQILSQFGRFRTVTPAWFHRWLWNAAQGLKQHRRGALLFFKVIRQISRSHATKNRRFWPELSVSGLYLQFEFTDGFEIMHISWYSIEYVPYFLARSSIKVDHMHLKIDDLNPIWVRLLVLDRSQLSNPSDLPRLIQNQYVPTKNSNVHSRWPLVRD